jgi:VWFA-related protein
MTLDVVVTDKSGKPVPGLQQDDFTLLDNKKPAKILAFRAVEGINAEAPVDVVIMIDAVNTAFTKVAFARDQIEKFLKRDGGELSRPVSLAFVTDSGITFGSEPSRDGNALVAELNQKVLGLRSINRNQGIFGADERLSLSLNAVEQLIRYEGPKQGRKLVIWISPGWPLLSGPGSELELTQKQKQSIFNSIVAFSDGLRQARITVNQVDPLGMSDAGGFQTFAYETFLKGVKTPSQAQNGNLALQVMAIESGGRVINSGNDVSAEIAQCVADANAFYQLNFALPEEGPAEYHALEIKLAKKGLSPHAPTGYYAH